MEETLAELVLYGECLAPSLKPAKYLFRDPSGREWCRVEQLSPWGFVHFTKFRMAAELDLAMEVLAWGARYTLRRERGWWKSKFLVLDQGEMPAWSLHPATFWGTVWTISETRTGAVATGLVRSPLIVGPQRARVEMVDGSVLATMTWEGYSLRLGTFGKVRVEIYREGWELPAVAFAVARWLSLQHR